MQQNKRNWCNQKIRKQFQNITHAPSEPDLTIKNVFGWGLVWWHTTLLPGYIPVKNQKFCWEKKILLKFEVFGQKKVVDVFCRFA